MSNVIRQSQVKVSDPVEAGYKLVLEKLFNAQNEVLKYEEKIKDHREELEKYKKERDQIQTEAKMIIEKAQAEAKRIIDEAMKEAEIIKENASKDGYNIGYSEGYQKSQEEIMKILDDIEVLKLDIYAQREKLLNKAYEELLILIPQLFRKIVERELQDKEFMYTYIRQSIEMLSIRNSITIKVCQDDFDIISINIEEITRGIEGLGNIQVKVDKALQCGDIIIETPYGSIETGLNSRFTKLEDIIRTLIGD
ncbi:FliH/SctL family protein [Caldicellulosiruptoraceae bacterium PP1]